MLLLDLLLAFCYSVYMQAVLNSLLRIWKLNNKGGRVYDAMSSTLVYTDHSTVLSIMLKANF